MKVPFISVLLSLLPFAASSPAAILSIYGFTGSADTPTALAGVNASAFTPSDGIGGSAGGTNGFSTVAVTNTAPAAATSPVRYVRGSSGSADTAAALENGDYFSFTLSPTSGNQLSLLNFTVDISANGTGTGGSATTNTAQFALFSSSDGFAAGTPLLGDILAPAASETALDGAALAYTRYTVDLSGEAFQNLTGTTTFRLYIANSSSAVGANARLDNVTVNGTVAAVPEPSALAFVSLGALALGTARSRRKRQHA